MAINWSEKNIAELELYFSTDIKTGLTTEQYRQSKEQYGENIIDSEVLKQQNFYGLKKKSKNIKAMLSGSVGLFGALYMLTFLILAGMELDVKIAFFLPVYMILPVFSFVLGRSAEKKYEYLYKAARPKALVVRQGKRKRVFIENIVPGDLILLSAGDIVPADARLVSAAYLSCIHINENGELTSEGKTADILQYNPTDIPANIVYATNIVDYGSASAVVFATGENTRIANLAESQGAKTGIFSKAEPEEKNENSFLQKRTGQISKILFLLSVVLSTIVILSGLLQQRDFLAAFMACLAAAAAGFPEQIPIVADYAALYGLHKLSKLGILVKKTSTIDEINSMDTIIAKRTESFTQDKMSLVKISEHDASGGDFLGTGNILSCMALCGSVSEHGTYKGRPAYSGSALDVAIFEALQKYGLDFDAVNEVYQKIGKTMYNPKSGIKSAVVAKEGGFFLVCFGEAFNVLARCSRAHGQRLERKSLEVYKRKISALYAEHDLVMAAAQRPFDYRAVGSPAQKNEESELEFLGLASFSEPKSSAVFESLDYLKKSGVTPVMISGSDIAQTKSSALKFGIIQSPDAAPVLDNEKIANMGDDTFYINAQKFRLFAPIALENKIKLLRALKFKKKAPAITVNDIEEIALLNEPCLSFTSVNTETGVLKNKASVITKNLTISTVLKAVKNAVLIYRNICALAQYASTLFFSQYLLLLVSALVGGQYIQTPAQIIWAGIGAGYLFSASICLNEGNKNWHLHRKNIKENKSSKKFENAMLKHGLVHGLLVFLCVLASFFVCLIFKEPALWSKVFMKYLATNGAYGEDIKSAQTAAFVSYIVSCASLAAGHIKGRRKFELGILKNKAYLAV
ncbi:MAG: hypothetical protein FWH48_11425, partial [Oscillospiraceae bacterium]|nr:hypothetical protein [Oscillospiraceae bacterium]